MNFLNYVGSIKSFLETALPTELNILKIEYPNVPVSNPKKYIEDFFDVDKYKDTIVVYITPDPEYTFEELSNESKLLANSLDIFVTFKGDTEPNLKALAKIYFEAFFEAVKKDESLGGLVDYAMIENMKFYDGIDGVQQAKAIYVRLKIVKEV
jgi:hypothetical protein